MKKVLYVPLDDRPVNLDDVITLGKSAGIHVITPPRSDIRNRLDSQKSTSGTTLLGTSSPSYGNTANIRQFILNHAASADGFIISTDMLAYGGLIGSRRLRTSGGGTYPDFDPVTTNLLDVIRTVKQSYPSKPIFVMDTVMRLATTTFAGGLTFDAYTESRSFMQQPRLVRTDFNDILTGYNLSPTSSEYGNTDQFNKDQYYNARQHKFKSNYYILDQLAKQGYIDFLAVGVDDANTQGVQINEIRFIENFINQSLGGSGGQNPDRAVILPDADGLGHSLMARMANQLYRGGAKPSYSVQYYGPHGSTITSPYEYMNVHQNIQSHVDIIGGQNVTDSPTLEILAITAASEVSNAVSRIVANSTNRVLTIVIDFVGSGPADSTVTEALLDCQHSGSILGYSAWNTPGNKIGIALGMGQARYAFLVTETVPSALNAAVNAHGSLLFKRFLKDYYYKKIAIGEIRTYSREHSMYTNVSSIADQNMVLFNTTTDYSHMLVLLRDRMQTHTATLAAKDAFLIDRSGASYNIRQISGSSWFFSSYAAATLSYSNPNFIWGRAFEVTLSPIVTLQ
ncbi:DUF4127 family protein [Paenibacillus solani]|uniref:DUF4127 domain-containing protein n=1 Tax=Paenibacillus solani TaxID=1705565 RepID=A0A0M1N3U2_9BACL|nr:DUF4127 family protein [Paenibacillus solani]KOR76644.1 hypothetical protein AM231_22100 [Paenibacillus solani]